MANLSSVYDPAVLFYVSVERGNFIFIIYDTSANTNLCIPEHKLLVNTEWQMMLKIKNLTI